jgi:hypothetical protein
MMIDATTSMIAMNVNETANVGNTNNDKTASSVNVARQTETAKDMLNGNAKTANKNGNVLKLSANGSPINVIKTGNRKSVIKSD